MPTKRVLIIDDEADIRAVVQGCLEEIAQWNVLTAKSGVEGLQLANTQQPDGILLDVSMPNMGGIEVLQQLRANPQTQSIPVVLLTAKATQEDRETYTQLGIVGLIIKPFDPMTLVEQIAEAFRWPV